METVSVILKQNSINVGFNFQLLLKDLGNGKILHKLPFTFVEYEIPLSDLGPRRMLFFKNVLFDKSNTYTQKQTYIMPTQHSVNNNVLCIRYLCH